MMDIQKELFEILNDQRYTTNHIAERTGISAQKIYRLQRMEGKLSAQDFYNICVAFEINLSQFDEL